MFCPPSVPPLEDNAEINFISFQLNNYLFEFVCAFS